MLESDRVAEIFQDEFLSRVHGALIAVGRYDVYDSFYDEEIQGESGSPWSSIYTWKDLQVEKSSIYDGSEEDVKELAKEVFEDQWPTLSNILLG